MQKLPRPSSETERMELKAGTRRALSLAGRANGFSLVTRVEPPVLSKYGSPSEEASFMPVDVVLDLEREIGLPLITEMLAAMQGFRLVPLDPQRGAQVGVEDLADVARETGDVVQKLAGALPGGIDAAETRELRKEIAEGVRALRRLDRKLGGGE